jgi:hypothetical protein
VEIEAGDARTASQEVMFPRPITINRRNYWRLGDLRRFYAAQAAKCGVPAPVTDTCNDENLLSTAHVRQRYGNVSHMTVWRWPHPADKQAAA